MRPLGLTVLLILISGCASPQLHEDGAVLVAKIRNSDVHWSGSYIGLIVRLTGATKTVLSRPSGQVVPLLIEALNDADRFVAAHVLLSEIGGFSAAGMAHGEADAFNELDVQLSANGQVSIPDAQRVRLHQKWTAWYANIKPWFLKP